MKEMGRAPARMAFNPSYPTFDGLGEWVGAHPSPIWNIVRGASGWNIGVAESAKPMAPTPAESAECGEMGKRYTLSPKP